MFKPLPIKSMQLFYDEKKKIYDPKTLGFFPKKWPGNNAESFAQQEIGQKRQTSRESSENNE